MVCLLACLHRLAVARAFVRLLGHHLVSLTYLPVQGDCDGRSSSQRRQKRRPVRRSRWICKSSPARPRKNPARSKFAHQQLAESHHCYGRVPEECPQEVASLIDSCLQTDPAARPTALEALDVLMREPDDEQAAAAAS